MNADRTTCRLNHQKSKVIRRFQRWDNLPNNKPPHAFAHFIQPNAYAVGAWFHPFWRM